MYIYSDNGPFHLDLARHQDKLSIHYEHMMKDLHDIQYALDQSSILVITDAAGMITYVNDRFCEISKYERHELLGQTHRLINSGFHPHSFFQHMWKTIKQGDIWKGDIKNRAKDGSEYWVNTTIVPFLDDQGHPYQFVSIRSDITDRKKAEEQLKTALKNDFRQTVKNLQNAVFKYKQTDEGEFQLTLLEGKILEPLGYTTSFVQGKKLDALFSAKVARKIKGYFAKAYKGKAVDFEVRIFKHIFLIYLSPIFEKGEIVEVVGTATDITERKKAEKAIYRVAHYDYLTGLPNRRLFQENMKMIDSLSPHYPFAVVYIDLDRIKNINDTMGHNIGDQVLKSVSRRIERCLRAGDTAARIGGDEFALLLPRADRKEAEERAEHLIHYIGERIAIHEIEIFVTASIGISMYPEDGQDSETLIKHADAAMYLAKENGKNNYQFFTKELDEKNAQKMKMERELHKALERGQFHLHYQPQFDLQSGHMLGVEALIRWEHPELGMVSPADFIPLAEETGLIIPIGKWVLQTACRQNKKWQEAGFPAIRVSVNVSVRQFTQPTFVNTVKEVLEQTGLSPEWLDLELTESMILEGECSHSVLQKLKDLNIHVSMDDFGTGYSSLSSLRHFSINRLKIDQTFVKTLDDTNKAIVAMIITLAKSLKMDVLAEGIETMEQAAFLKEMNCQEVQGYFFAKPMPMEKMNVFFKRPLVAFP
ncbi:sensor domain-containing protein [Domibacillus mangrovi]|uniref:PAS domain S-box protein n=1 Tax=Domibacillus mangrovi TaxID=1714354 RepID=A0A1Q5P270_9BACI|nr:bifunctional diguanylate cyclase/phosphodiesterase [Domibacillus mangrovi]OKL36337.1 PAS domain S-box protein [Domibacillus mangrovi]